MLLRGAGGKVLLLGSLLALSFPLYSTIAAAQHRPPAGPHAIASRGSAYPRMVASGRGSQVRFVAFRHGGFRLGLNGGMKSKNRLLARRGGYGIQCVAFAKSETGIELSGNAVNWWENAAGVYQRGSRPQLGSVLNFQANGRMHLGHVAVVTNVVDSRQIDIDQANWPGPGIYGGVARDIRVVDVSPNNDWTAVRVALGHTSDFGSVYPTFGFIYDRADNGVMLAAGALRSAPIPALNPAPSDLRLSPMRAWQIGSGQSVDYDEVAEAPEAAPALRHWHPRHR